MLCALPQHHVFGLNLTSEWLRQIPKPPTTVAIATCASAVKLAEVVVFRVVLTSEEVAVLLVSIGFTVALS